MSVFTMRDGSEIDSDQLSDVEANADRDEMSNVEANVRDLVRRDGANLRREPESETDVVTGNIGSLLQRVSGNSVQEIDRLIGELQVLREMLDQESKRVRQEVMDYATRSQSALHSTKIIAESLANWRRLPGSGD